MSTMASRLLRRAYSSKAARAPTLADIVTTPESVAAFKAAQEAWKTRQAEEESARAARLENKAQPADYSSRAGLGLGSLTTAVPDSEHKEGRLATLLYGTKEGREMDAKIEASFSELLKRGKYVHEIVFHRVKPSKVDEYVELVGNFYPQLAKDPVHLVGSWRTQVGDCDTFVHIWEYQQYTGFHSAQIAQAAHPEFRSFDKGLRKCLISQDNSLMQEFSFWPTTPPRRLGGVFELRSYTLHPGKLLEWEQHWRQGLAARRGVMEGVGAWFTQIGELSTVHYLWQFANLEERRLAREKSWEQQGWSGTVHKTVPLIQSMKSRVMVGMDWSPVS